MKLLEETVRELKGEELEDETRATVNLRVDLKIDDAYIPDMNQRLMVYRKIAAARTEHALISALEDLRDRYGAPPDSVLNLAEYGRIRIMADHLGVDTIDREGRLVVIKFRPNAKVDPMRLVKTVGAWPGATLVPPVSVKLDLEAPREEAPAAPRPATPVVRPVHPGRPWERKVPGGALPGGSGGPGRGRLTPSTSWWTARATAGEVKAGFTKEEILRKPEQNPRAEGGMFPRLAEFLEELGG